MSEANVSYAYATLSVEQQDGVLYATISNPPVNVMTLALYADLVDFTEKVAADDAVRVVVMQSADPDFFIAHFDVSVILTFPIDTAPERAPTLSPFHTMCERMRTMGKPTIAKLAGRVGGGGNEFAAACDMRFGVKDRTIINQMEVPLGILPGGGGTQHLPRLMGRSRALEVILGAEDLDAETAERWGYLNRIFPDTASLDTFVERLAKRMAAWPAGAVALAKASVLNAEPPMTEGLLDEAFLFQQTLRLPESQVNMQAAMDQGAQTRAGEARIGALMAEVAEAVKKPAAK
jgi:enoyl-CoA hydratase/carnithine racemase